MLRLDFLVIKELADFSDRIWFYVDKIKDVREIRVVLEVLVGWKGLTKAGDSCEPLNIIFEDAPTKVNPVDLRV